MRRAVIDTGHFGGFPFLGWYNFEDQQFKKVLILSLPKDEAARF
jgi:hypothetical protein